MLLNLPNVISNFLIALILTIFAEIFIAYLFGYRDKRSLAIILLINLITNPILNYIIHLNYIFNIFRNTFVVIFLLEAIVIFVEWRMLIYAFSSKSKDYKRLFLLSLISNISSFILGIILFELI